MAAPAQADKLLLDGEALRRTIARIAHEIVERNPDLDRTALVGIHTRGVPVAQRIRRLIEEFTDREISLGTLDITFHRDDLTRLARQPEVKGTDLPFDLGSSTLVVVDDVLYTGRTVRAAMDALVEHGRPLAVRLVVLVDRGHRELPIRADHVGKNVPTSQDEVVQVRLHEIDGDEDEVLIAPIAEPVGSAPGVGAQRVG